MNVKLLIDAIVRQTTVLIAQLSTAAGVRANRDKPVAAATRYFESRRQDSVVRSVPE